MGRIKKTKQNKQKKETQPINPKGQDQQIQKVMMYTGMGVIAIVVIFLVISTLQEDPPIDFNLASQPSLGSPDAPVKVIEFGDWKCPHCKVFHDQTFPELEEDFINTGQVEFYFMNFPLELGPDSMTAALGSECVYAMGEEYFWRYYDAIYENQGDESEIWATTEFLADQVELHVNPDFDREAFIQCIEERQYSDQITSDQETGLSAGVRGTPTILVNGERSSSDYVNLSGDIVRALENSEPEE